jgi:hypothetical protein
MILSKVSANSASWKTATSPVYTVRLVIPRSLNSNNIAHALLKGTVARDFCSWFFSWIDPIWAPNSYPKTFSNSGSNSRRYSNFEVVLRGIRLRGTQKNFQIGGSLSMNPTCLGKFSLYMQTIFEKCSFKENGKLSKLFRLVLRGFNLSPGVWYPTE